MTAQLDLPLVRARRDDGIERAIAHAEAVKPDWRKEALDWVRHYAAMSAAPFLAEEVRDMAEAAGFTAPPDGRAWGQVMRDAQRERVVVKVGYAPARSSNLSPKVQWRRA